MARTIKLTDAEGASMDSLLDSLLEMLSNAGSNDFYLPDNRGNRQMVLEAMSLEDPDEPFDDSDLHIVQGKILASSMTVLDLLRHRIKES